MQNENVLRMAKNVAKKAIIKASSGKFNPDIKSILGQTIKHESFDERPLSALEDVCFKTTKGFDEDGVAIEKQVFGDNDITFLTEVVMSGCCRIVQTAERNREWDQRKKGLDTRIDDYKEPYAGTSDEEDEDGQLYHDGDKNFIGDMIYSLDIIAAFLYAEIWSISSSLEDEINKDNCLPWGFKEVTRDGFREKEYVFDFDGAKECNEAYRKRMEQEELVLRKERKREKKEGGIDL